MYLLITVLDGVITLVLQKGQVVVLATQQPRVWSEEHPALLSPTFLLNISSFAINMLVQVGTNPSQQ